jgi:class 3 adenylate cyclase/predicted ATPase
MQQIADWLQKLGLGQFAQTFAENEIDVSVLSHLTDQDLKDIGIPLGPRRKILAAIGTGAATAQAEPEPVGTSAPKVLDTAERRQVTVMFTDLVGSTALSAHMDPEDLREVIAAYQKRVAKTVLRFGGFVAKYMGDGVLVYFGYPEAHEDDAERAVRAGLELVATLPEVNASVPTQTRVGIATGLVIVGGLIGTGESQERGIVGETPNLAARLQSIAEANTVVIDEGTRKLLGKLFELEDLGPKALKGFDGPLRAFAALRANPVESRFEAFHPTELTELVGREEEIELMLRRWLRAKSGEGQVVLLCGEAGIGKSRLTAALVERLTGEPHMRLRYFCSPQHTDSTLYPILSQMERAAGFAHDDTPQQKLDKLDALLAQSATSQQDAALIAEALSLPNDGRYPMLDLTPQQRRQKTLEALDFQLEALARQNPVLTICEDAHWADPTTLEAFGRTVDRIRTVRGLLIVTFRPEFQAPWVGQPHVTALTLNRLTASDIAAMIDRVSGNRLLPASIREDILERTDGIPLFVEEMTKAVLEAAIEGEALQTMASIPAPSLAVPASLHASLMARLDRLGPAKEIAQIGAAIGREFSHALLAGVARKSDAQLNAALDRLNQSGLLFRRGVAPNASYLFKHALVQDAAYSTLLREPRAALHTRIVKTLEDQFPGIAESQPELLARHCAQAGQTEKAASLWGKAGQRSLERSALIEAAEQMTRALGQIAALPSTPALRREEIKLQVALITPLMQVKGHAAPETKAAAERARLLIQQAEALGEPPEDPLLLFSVLYGFWVTSHAAFDGEAMRELAAQFLELAEKQRATAPLMVGHRLMGSSFTLMGDSARGRQHYDQAMAFYDLVTHRPLLTRFGQDVGVATLSYRSLALWLLGYPEAAQADNVAAVQNARALGHGATLMLALIHSSITQALFCGHYLAARSSVDELIALVEEKGALFWKIVAALLRGYLLALTGNAAEAIPILRANIAAWQANGTKMFMPLWLAYYARACADSGQLDLASRTIDEAIATVEATGERWIEPELYRIAGEHVLASTARDFAKAQAYFERALVVARAQQAKSWELRAATSMARLWRDQGRRDEARVLLAPVYGWFTEGFETLDLRNAKALLDSLAS